MNPMRSSLKYLQLVYKASRPARFFRDLSQVRLYVDFVKVLISALHFIRMNMLTILLFNKSEVKAEHSSMEWMTQKQFKDSFHVPKLSKKRYGT